MAPNPKILVYCRRSPIVRWILALAAILPVAAAVAKPIDPRNPPQGRFLDEWLEVYMAGGKVGYAHSTLTRNGDTVRTRMEMHIKLVRAAQEIEIQTVESTGETLDGRPLTFASETHFSTIKTAMRGVVKDGRVSITTSQLGMEQTQTFDFPQGALMNWGNQRATWLHGFNKPTRYSLRIYQPSLRLDDALEATTTVGAWQDLTLNGRTHRACRLDVDLRSPMGELKSVSWVDTDGNTLKITMAMPGMGDMEMVLSDQATALARFVPPEMFVSTAIPIGRSLNPSALQRVRYRLRTTNPDATLDDLPTTGMQTVVSAAKDKVILEVTRQSHRPGGRRRGHGSTAHGKTNTARVMTTAARMNGVRTAHALASDKATSPGASGTPSDDLADYLGANLMINTADPMLIRLAGKAAGGEREPFALGDKLRRFVSTYVSNKNLSIGFATASEVGRKREGDCSEHGVLLAALGRINGLPSRVAVGLAYVPSFGGRKDIFGYHLWTQFHIDGRWVDFDAALRESQCSPTRIAFATSSLKDTGLADLSLPLIDKIGSIAIDILDTEDLAAPTP